MRGLLIAVVGMLGLAAWWQRRRQRHDVDYSPPADLGPDPAEELRAKLAENRAADDDDEPDEAPPEPERSPLDPESRRRDVHERARASMDELGTSDT